MERADESLAGLMRAVHLARRATRCDYITVTARGGRLSAALAVPCGHQPGTYTVHLLMVTASAPGAADKLVPLVRALTPAAITGALQLAAARAHTHEQSEAFRRALALYRSELEGMSA